MQTRTNQQVQFGDELIWRASDAEGWSFLERYHDAEPFPPDSLTGYQAWIAEKPRILIVASRRFQHAIEFASTSIQEAQSTIGLLWTEYLEVLRSRPDDAQLTIKIDSNVDSLRTKAHSAIRSLEASSLLESQRFALARGYQLCGLLDLELCLGEAGFNSLKKSAELFKALNLHAQTSDMLHLLAKLHQCREENQKAIQLLQEVEKSPDKERRARAFLDRVMTMNWLGQSRNAWLLFHRWKSYRDDLNPLSCPLLILKGNLLFASIATTYGEFSEAEALFQTANCAFQCHDFPDLCAAVFHLLYAELAYETGELTQAIKRVEQINWTIPVPTAGFDFLELLFLGSGCRHCVVECWFCERWCSVPCRGRVPYCIKFEKEAELAPIDVSKLMSILISSLKARIRHPLGDLPGADQMIAEVLKQMPAAFRSDRIVSLKPRLTQFRVAQERDVDYARIRLMGNELMTLQQSGLGERNAAVSLIYHTLGRWRSKCSEEEVAQRLLQDALRIGLTNLHPHHPDILLIRADYSLFLASRALPDDPDFPVDKVIEAFSHVSCFDHRRLSALRNLAWMKILAHRHQSAIACLVGIERLRQEFARHHSPLKFQADSNAIFAQIAARVELFEVAVDVRELFSLACQATVAEADLKALAHELNRLTLLLMAHNCYRSAFYFAKRSHAEYVTIKDQHNANTLEKTVKLLEQNAARGGISLDGL